MRQFGSVEVPQEAFMAVLKLSSMTNSFNTDGSLKQSVLGKCSGGAFDRAVI